METKAIVSSLEYKITGEGMQTVEMTLQPGQTLVAEGGAMNYMDLGITFRVLMGDGTKHTQGFFKKLFGASKRMLGGESIFLTHFTNTDSEPKQIALSSPYPGKILAINLSQTHNTLNCQKGSFLCTEKGTHIDISFVKKVGVGLLGGEGFIMQRFTGAGLVFLHAGGSVIIKQLKEHTIFVDVGCVVAFTEGIDYTIRRAGNLKSMFLGGQGRFLARLSGTGTVYIQSIPFSRLADRIIENAPSHGGKSGGESGLLGGLGRWIGGGG